MNEIAEIQESTADALRNLKAKTELTRDETPTEGPKSRYQQYNCSRISTCFITPTGKRANFTNYEYYTKDPEIISYLDKVIREGSRVIQRGQLVNAEDINPMAALKRRHIEEFLASQEGRDFSSGTLSAEKILNKSSILSSSDVVTG